MASLLGDSTYYDPEVGMEVNYMDAKYQRQIRHEFIRKVYALLSIQLLITAVVTYAFIGTSLAPTIRAYGWGIQLVGIIGSLITICYLYCKKDASRNYPTNYILLAIFTGFESLMVGSLCSYFRVGIVLQALVGVTIIVGALTLFSFQTSYDFTSWMAFLYYSLIGLIAFGLILMFFPGSNVMRSIYATIGALLFSVYLVIDTQLLIGRGKIAVSEDDYIMMVIMLYLDIINIFVYLLQCLQSSSND